MKAPAPALRDLLHKHIARKEEERPPWRLHASDITKEDGFCGRYPILMKMYSDPKGKEYIPLPSKNVTTSMAVTWEWGRLVERRVIDWFGEIGIAHGDWLCSHFGCGQVHEWRTKPPACIKCGGKNFRYIEPRATSAYSGASSGLDVLLRLPGRKLFNFAEVKSIDAEAFKAKLLGPLAEHRARTALSLRNIAESEDPRMKEVDDQLAYVLYVSKGGYGVKTPIEGGFSPFKDFPIHRNDATTEPYVEPARAAHLALKGEGPMPQRYCKHFSDKKAQHCPAMKKCWQAELAALTK